MHKTDLRYFVILSKTLLSLFIFSLILSSCKPNINEKAAPEIMRFRLHNYYDNLGKSIFDYYSLSYRRTVNNSLVCHRIEETVDLNDVYEVFPEAEFLSFALITESRNDTFHIDPVLKKFTNLKRLDINCQGSHLAGIEIIEKLTSLRRLDLTLHYIPTINLDLKELTNLEYLDIYMGNAIAFPNSILDAKNIEFLDLSGFDKMSVKDTLYKLQHLTQLQHLTITSNNLIIQDNKPILPNLKVYNHYSNKLSLTNSIDYQKLKRCEIGQSITRFPEKISFDSLELLRIGSTRGFADIKINDELKVLQIDPRRKEECEIDVSQFMNLKSLTIHGIEKITSMSDIKNPNITEIKINYDKVSDSIRTDLKILNKYLQARTVSI